MWLPSRQFGIRRLAPISPPLRLKPTGLQGWALGWRHMVARCSHCRIGYLLIEEAVQASQFKRAEA
uniref:Uncharacterized protein n=1 Tax=Arundo donax TaxID=35708 RepID=A0A0A9EQM9_ARUDO